MAEGFEKFDLTGKTALVTGGATGIGYHLTKGLIKSGARVLISARREDVLVAAAEQLTKEISTGEVIYRVVDLNDPSSVSQLSDYVLDELGGVDIFVGNAGQDLLYPIDSYPDESILQSFQVNTMSNIQLVRDLLPTMRKNRWGRIIFSSSSSTTAASAQEGISVYCSTKAALNAFARAVAAEAGHDGVTANSINFGMYVTPMIDQLWEDIRREKGPEFLKEASDSFASVTALGRLGRCDEVEGAIQFIASDAGSYLTGSTIVLDGGTSIMLRPNVPPEAPVYPSK
jgi:NAD(P)-dependent dehydrogenase (short-subunit alcohol dehydrogenase family)